MNCRMDFFLCWTSFFTIESLNYLRWVFTFNLICDIFRNPCFKHTWDCGDWFDIQIGHCVRILLWAATLFRLLNYTLFSLMFPNILNNLGTTNLLLYLIWNRGRCNGFHLFHGGFLVNTFYFRLMFLILFFLLSLWLSFISSSSSHLSCLLRSSFSFLSSLGCIDSISLSLLLFSCQILSFLFISIRILFFLGFFFLLLLLLWLSFLLFFIIFLFFVSHIFWF